MTLFQKHLLHSSNFCGCTFDRNRTYHRWNLTQKKNQLEIEEEETNPMLMQIVAPNEPVLLLSFEVVMGENSGLLNYCIPFKVVEPIIDEFTQTNWFSALEDPGSDDERTRILSNIRKAPLDITVTLAEVNISLSDLLTMKPGDILDCDTSATSELVLSVGAEESFVGRPGSFKRKKALLVTSMIEREGSPKPWPTTPADEN